MVFRNMHKLIGIAIATWLAILGKSWSQEIDVEHVINVISALENDIRVIEFEVDMTSGKLESIAPPMKVSSQGNGQSSAFVRFDPRGRKYFVRILSVLDADTVDKQGMRKRDTYASHSEFSNDSTTFRTWNRGSLGKTIPEEKFVKKKASSYGRKANADQIVISPDPYDLGGFLCATKENEPLKPISANIKLTNSGRSPILVASVQSTCGCALVGWPGGIILPGNEQNVQVNVMPASWGRGKQQKAISVVFGDRTVKQSRIIGNGYIEPLATRLTLSEEEAVIDGSVFLSRNNPVGRLERQFVVRGPAGTLAHTAAASNVPWCAVHLESVDLGESRLVVVLNSQPELLRQLSSSVRKASADVTLTEEKTQHQMSLKVRVFRQAVLRAANVRVQLTRIDQLPATNELLGEGPFGADELSLTAWRLTLNRAKYPCREIKV